MDAILNGCKSHAKRIVMWYYLYMGFFIIGMVLFYVAARQYQLTNKLISSGTKTTATVIDLLESTNDKGNTLYQPVFEFPANTGDKVRFISNVRSRPASYKMGDQVPVIYNTNNTDEVKIIGFWGLYRWTTVSLSIGAPFFIIGCMYLLYTKNLL